MADVGLSHIALPVHDLDASVAFYETYAGMHLVHRRPGVAWVTDHTRPFAIVLFQASGPITPLLPLAHLGVAVGSPAEVDRLCALARGQGCLARDPQQSGPPVGYWALLSDPDGHTLEISYGQDVEGVVKGEALEP